MLVPALDSWEKHVHNCLNRTGQKVISTAILSHINAFVKPIIYKKHVSLHRCQIISLWGCQFLPHPVQTVVNVFLQNSKEKETRSRVAYSDSHRAGLLEEK